MTNALYKTDIRELAYRPKVLADSQFTFSTEIETLPVTNQKKSGRCWIFAALNLLREKAAKTLDLDSFELSQNYMAFWDKLEKVNYFLESMIALADRPVDDRLVSYLLTTGIADGGQWDMEGIRLHSTQYQSSPKERALEMLKLVGINEPEKRLKQYPYELSGGMTIQSEDWNVFLEERKSGNFDFAREGWLADFNDPINMLEMWVTESGNNDCQFGKTASEAAASTSSAS